MIFPPWPRLRHLFEKSVLVKKYCQFNLGVEHKLNLDEVGRLEEDIKSSSDKNIIAKKPKKGRLMLLFTWTVGRCVCENSKSAKLIMRANDFMIRALSLSLHSHFGYWYMYVSLTEKKSETVWERVGYKIPR